MSDLTTTTPSWEKEEEEEEKEVETELQQLIIRTKQIKDKVEKSGNLSEHTEKFNELEFWFNQYINPEFNHNKQRQLERSNTEDRNFNEHNEKVIDSKRVQINNAKRNFQIHMETVIKNKNYQITTEDVIEILIEFLKSSTENNDFMGAVGLVESTDKKEYIKITLIYRGHMFILYFNVEDAYDRKSYKIINHHFVKFSRDLYREQFQKVKDVKRRQHIMVQVNEMVSLLPKDHVRIVIFCPSLERSYVLLEDF